MREMNEKECSLIIREKAQKIWTWWLFNDKSVLTSIIIHFSFWLLSSTKFAKVWYKTRYWKIASESSFPQPPLEKSCRYQSAQWPATKGIVTWMQYKWHEGLQVKYWLSFKMMHLIRYILVLWKAFNSNVFAVHQVNKSCFAKVINCHLI